MPRLNSGSSSSSSNGSSSQSILIHAASSSAIATAISTSPTSALDERLNRSGSSLMMVGVGAGNHNSTFNNHDTSFSTNTSIVSERPTSIRKVPLKTCSFSASPLTSRFLQQRQSDAAPILPDRMPGSDNNSNNHNHNHNHNHVGAASSLAAAAKRRLSQFRASEKGKGDVLPLHSYITSSSPQQRSRAMSSTASCCSTGSGDGGGGGAVGSEPQLRSRRKTSMRVQPYQQPQSDEISASEHHANNHSNNINNNSNNNNNSTFELRRSWSDESDTGTMHHQNEQHQHQHQQQHQQQQQMYNSQNSQQNHNHSYTPPPSSTLQHQYHQYHHHASSQKHYPLQRETSHVMGGIMCGSGGGGSSSNSRGGDNKKYYATKSQPPQTLWLGNMTPVQFITVMLLLAITCFVAGSYTKVLATTDVLKDVKHEESLLLLHLQRVEQASLQLHENLSRLNDRSSSSSSSSNVNNNNQHEHSNNNNAAAAASAGNSVLVDSDLIRIQTEKLREMEAELDHEVRALQKKIQQSARRSIVENYGEGAVQVYLDLVNPEGDEEENESDEQEHAGSLDSSSADAGSAGGGRNAKNRIAIRLWYDTPHSAWTFLSQVSRGQWDNAVMDWNVAATGGRSIAARAAGGATTLEPELHFVEQSERGHERYTIGLNTDTGSLFINLQDNRDFYKSEPCVGTIVNGFDVLHRVIRAAQKHSAAAGAGNGNNSNPVRIKRARVSHVTTRA